MGYYPLFLELRGKPVLVVGGGVVAGRKVEALLAAGARVTVVAPQIAPGLRSLVAGLGREAPAGSPAAGSPETPAAAPGAALELVERGFRPEDLAGMVLAVGAASDPPANVELARAARARGVLVNVADAPELCDFIVPAVVGRGGLQVAVSTGGASPALAARLRRRLEEALGPEYGVLVEVLAEFRPRVLAELENRAARERLFEAAASDWMLRLAREEGPERVRARLEEMLRQAKSEG